MDGKGRALDNIYIERFWRSIKYEQVSYGVLVCNVPSRVLLSSPKVLVKQAKSTVLQGILMISASVKNLDDLARLNEKDIPDNKLLAFVGTREADP